MRRKDREIADPEKIDAIIRQGQICHIGIADTDIPYVVPLNYGYDTLQKCFYFHSAKEGRKVELLRKGGAAASGCPCAFEITAVCTIIHGGQRACAWGTVFSSVMGKGRIMFVSDAGEKRKGLDCIMAQYSEQSGWIYSEDELSKVLVLRMDIETMSAKQSKG